MVDPSPTIVEKISLSVAAVPTVTYHWLWSLSYCIGCPISPAILSDTLLSTWRIPPLSLNAIPTGVLLLASFNVWAILIWFAFTPVVIAKYTALLSNLSGRWPFSEMTRILSPCMKLWSAVRVKVASVVASLSTLLIPATDLPTVNFFWKETWVSES